LLQFSVLLYLWHVYFIKQADRGVTTDAIYQFLYHDFVEMYTSSWNPAISPFRQTVIYSAIQPFSHSAIPPFYYSTIPTNPPFHHSEKTGMTIIEYY
jgi:hypothetical protein